MTLAWRKRKIQCQNVLPFDIRTDQKSKTWLSILRVWHWLFFFHYVVLYSLAWVIGLFSTTDVPPPRRWDVLVAAIEIIFHPEPNWEMWLVYFWVWTHCGFTNCSCCSKMQLLLDALFSSKMLTFWFWACLVTIIYPACSVFSSLFIITATCLETQLR